MQAQPLRAFALDLNDAVAHQYSSLECRRVFHRRDDRQKIVAHSDDNAHAAKGAFGIILQFVVLLGVHELAVRVERIEHPFQRVVNQFFVGEFIPVHIVSAHPLQHAGEQLHVLVPHIILFTRLGVRKVDAGPEEQIERESGEKQAV